MSLHVRNGDGIDGVWFNTAVFDAHPEQAAGLCVDASGERVTVHLDEGAIRSDGTQSPAEPQDATLQAPDPVGPRTDLIGLDAAGVMQVIAGVPVYAHTDETPTPPDASEFDVVALAWMGIPTASDTDNR